MSLFAVELTPCVRVNAAADKSFRLDYKKLSLKLCRAPSSDKEYSGPISAFRAESLVIVTISACRESVGVCACHLAHMFERIDKTKCMYLCVCTPV